MDDLATHPLRMVSHRLLSGMEELMRENSDHREKLTRAFSVGISRVNREDVPERFLARFDRLRDSLKRIQAGEGTAEEVRDASSVLFHLHDEIDGEFVRLIEEGKTGSRRVARR